ncbi:MAG: carbohydrate porin, partial [Deltaproteobacteria bacterium]|nr:carbohydrate porin [Deltaproteobacteria bacterium]
MFAAWIWASLWILGWQGKGRADEETKGAESAEAPSKEQKSQGSGEDGLRKFLSGFQFGSYGRIVVASDLQGRNGRQARIVSFAPRVDEDDTYAEVELRREDRIGDIETKIVATMAFAGPLFHFDGDFSERIAIRNLFAEANSILVRGLGAWAGSRMVRGDDVYLLNFWPMDNLNMVGGGLRYAIEDKAEVSAQVGLHQPNDPFQRQVIRAPARVGFVPEEVPFLDRPRTVLSGRLTYWFFGRFERTGVKGVLYGEQHFLGAGERRRQDGAIERLPEDSGFVLGLQFGAYHSESRTFANLLFRYARGLGVYDPMSVPFRSGSVVTTGRAEHIRIALSANWEWNENKDIGIGVQVGGYFQIQHEADPALWNRVSRNEGVLSLRPHFWFGEVAG